MKVIFLDMDGVMNSGEWWYSGDRPKCGVDAIDRAAVVLLEDMLRRDDGIHVVISSAWRIIHPRPKILAALVRHGLPEDLCGRFIGMTRLEPHRKEERIHEIEAWLDEHGEVTHWAVLDDNGLGEDTVHLVQTDFETGLRWRHVRCVLELLGVRP